VTILFFSSKIFGAGLDPPARRRVGNYFAKQSCIFPEIGLSCTDIESWLSSHRQRQAIASRSRRALFGGLIQLYGQLA
jgi:hypothetical protein